MLGGMTSSAAVDPLLANALKIGGGICWTAAYILIFRRGLKDRTYGMPLAALAANIAWEAIFSFLLPHKPPQLQVNRVWFLFDLGLVWQALRHGRAEMPYPWLQKNFRWVAAGTFLCGFLGVWTTTWQFQDWDGMYAAFGQNLMMSILFVAMLLRRDDIRGQSLWIGIAKMVGTVLPSILFHLKYPDAPLLNFLYVAIFLFDLLYCAILFDRIRTTGESPWKRL